MIQETGSNHPTSLYIYTDQNSYEPLARIDTDGNQEQHIRYFHTDLNGCPEELTDANGKILWECSFQLWGKRIHEIEHEPIEQNLRYQGQYLDKETGLHYNTFRYYDPDIGRFTQPDPIGLLGGLNLYQYAPNALTWVDPWGLNGSYIFRGMTEEKGEPKVGDSARTLGVRPNRDIPVDTNGNVHPNTGGVSVSPSPQDLPPHRKPIEFGGTGKDPVWKLDVADLGNDLQHVPDKPGHGTIQPKQSMPLSKYQTALANLKSKWIKC